MYDAIDGTFDSGNPTVETLYEFPKSSDVTTVVRLIEVEQFKYIDIRDYLHTKSAEAGAPCWGRGYWLDYDPDMLTELASALIEVASRE